MKGKKSLLDVTFNVQTLHKEGKKSERIASSENTGHDIICIQEHRLIHDDSVTKEHSIDNWKLYSCSAWRNNNNASMSGIGILLNDKAYMLVFCIQNTH